ncbi:MAG: VWA domain-containing protein [Thermodesulfobacteriota bacterium]
MTYSSATDCGKRGIDERTATGRVVADAMVEGSTATEPVKGTEWQRFRDIPGLAPFRYTVVRVLVCLLVAFHCSRVTAGGILHVFPPELKDRLYAVARPTVTFSRTLVTVSDSLIEWRVEQTFFNDNEFPLQALYILPVEGEDFYRKPLAKIDGTPVDAAVVPWDELFPTLKECTEAIQDPALLSLAGKTVLLIRPLTIGIRDQKTFRIEFTQANPARDDNLLITVPLDGERYALAPVPKLEVKVRFKMSQPVRSIFSATHYLTTLRESPTRCLVTLETQSERVKDDFRLLTTFSGTDLNVSAFFHKLPGKEGACMLLVEPPLRKAGPKLQKDVVIALDCSGSMSGQALESVKAAVISVLASLGETDRFNVVTIRTQTDSFAQKLLPATRQNVASAVRFINSQKSEGGTDLYNGLRAALEHFRSRERTAILILVSDGKSTVGINKPQVIVTDVESHNKARARIFALAVGKQADISLLDRLAAATRGSSLHLPEVEDTSEAVRRFLSQVSPPSVADISVRCSHISPEDVLPTPVPDLFGQESLVVLGTYNVSRDTEGELRVKGKVSGRSVQVTKSVVLPDAQPQHAHIPRIWAMRRIAHLCDQIQLKGPSPELTAKITALADQFGFLVPDLTPLTAIPYGAGIESRASGRLLWKYKTSCVPSDVLSDKARIIEDKVFLIQGRTWIDRDYQPSLPTTKIRFLSPQYFSLLKGDPRIGRYLALGSNVIFVKDAMAYKIVAEQ